MKVCEFVVEKTEEVSFHFRKDEEGRKVCVVEKTETQKQTAESKKVEIATKNLHIWIPKEAYSYQEPYMLPGYKYVKDKWNTGIQIMNEEDGSLFTWIPVSSLQPNGSLADWTVDDAYFNNQFGHRIFKRQNNCFTNFSEKINSELLESVRLYGGFFISSCVASKSETTGKLYFGKGEYPLIGIRKNEAIKEIEKYYQGKDFAACMGGGSVYDSINEWIIEMKALGEETYSKVVEDSTSWGNYLTNPNFPNKLVKTGEDGCVLNLYGWSGNVSEWITDIWKGCRDAISGSCFNNWNASCRKDPVADRYYVLSGDITPGESFVGFRSVIYKKAT